MINIEVSTSKKYTVSIGEGFLAHIGEMTAAVHKICTAAVITDDVVGGLYSDTVINSLQKAGFKTVKFVFKHGERSKNLTTYSEILSFLSSSHITKSDIAIALGGGVVGDLTGFAAATYLRGIDFVQIPTTLLAMVDSSVGGKTGVDLPEGKNLVGAFHQPSAVFCDTHTLITLPPDIFADGVAEAIKAGIICDGKLFELIENGDARKNITEIISKAVSVKRGIVEADEREAGERRLLNLGHTFGHAIEKASNFSVSHGHAVAIGTAIASRIADKTGFSENPCSDKIIKALIKNNLPYICTFSAKELVDTSLTDKKRSGDTINIILPKKIGLCMQKSVPIEELENLIKIGLS